MNYWKEKWMESDLTKRRKQILVAFFYVLVLLIVRFLAFFQLEKWKLNGR